MKKFVFLVAVLAGISSCSKKDLPEPEGSPFVYPDINAVMDPHGHNYITPADSVILHHTKILSQENAEKVISTIGG